MTAVGAAGPRGTDTGTAVGAAGPRVADTGTAVGAAGPGVADAGTAVGGAFGAAAGSEVDLVVHGDEPPPGDPFELALAWLPADADPDRPQVTLATTGLDGTPDARTVLLTTASRDGVTFYTAATSAKVAELAADPRAAMVVLWPGFTRQLVLRGDVVPTTDDETAAAYASRSAYLRQMAWINLDDLAALPRAERVSGWQAFAAEQPDPPQPDGWVGFRLVPRQLTFWVSSPDTASRRLRYDRTDLGWTHSHLAG